MFTKIMSVDDSRIEQAGIMIHDLGDNLDTTSTGYHKGNNIFIIENRQIFGSPGLESFKTFRSQLCEIFVTLSSHPFVLPIVNVVHFLLHVTLSDVPSLLGHY